MRGAAARDDVQAEAAEEGSADTTCGRRLGRNWQFLRLNWRVIACRRSLTFLCFCAAQASSKIAECNVMSGELRRVGLDDAWQNHLRAFFQLG